MKIELHLGDCLEVMAELPENSVDTILTDPPYGLTFMGKDWDRGVPGVAFWREALRVAKPGAMLLAMGGTRTFHRLVCAIEDAGWEIRDSMAWLYGSGFPKSYNIEKGGAGAEWHGWGTALKPAMELICVAMKPIDGTFVNNALTWGVAGLWIDGTRIPGESVPINVLEKWSGFGQEKKPKYNQVTNDTGRFPANVIHDGSDEVTGLFPMTGVSSGGRIGNKGSALNMMGTNYEAGDPGYGDSGSAARFFYCAKSSRSERNAGLDGSEIVMIQLTDNSKTISGGKEWESQARSQKHLVDMGRLVARAIGESTWMVDTKWSIESFGKSIMEASPTDITFTTKTGTNLTTTSPTLNYLMRLLISDSIQGVKLETGNGGNPARIAEGCSQSLSITIGQTASLPGVGNVASGTQLIISVNEGNATENKPGLLTNFHSTVKPLALMRYLARLTKTPTGGVVLDPFMGSGTTGMAAVLEGRDFIGIELNPEYLEIAERRIAEAQLQPRLPLEAE